MATTIPVNRVPLDARFAAEATGGLITRLRGSAPVLARGVTADSRAASPGCAFVALRGAQHDGHAFVLAAVEAGAVLVVVEHGRAPEEARVDVVEVDDTLTAWGQVAHAHLSAWRSANARARVVAITGSAGKTTTKELCAALLRTKAECHATSGNLNNLVGVPAVMFGVEPRHRFAVLEMGMSVPGEIAALAAIAEPDLGLVTNVGLAHAGGVGGTADDVAREKGALFAAVRAGGSVVANADDEAVMAQAARVPDKRHVTFGRDARADVRLVSREALGIDASRVVVERAGRRAAFEIPLAGEAAAIDFVAALAAADTAAGPLDEGLVASALRTVAPLEGRMDVYRVGDIIVLDDAYNANPASMRAALATLAEIGRHDSAGENNVGARHPTRRVAVLGEMKELGPGAEREHAALGEAVAAAGVTLLVSCGGLADVIADVAATRGVQAVFARDAAHAALEAVELVRPGDAVLVKGSRSVGAELVVAALADSIERRTGSVLYELLFPLRHDSDWLGFLNVLRYVPFRTIASTASAMFLAFALSPWFIRELQRKQIGQVVRSDGPESHKVKSGTPTMGGSLILLCVLLPTILWCDLRNVFVWATTAVTAGYGVIGYLDDYLKIKLKNPRGVPGRYKLLGQFAIASAVLSYAFLARDHLPADWWDIRFNLGVPFLAFSKHPIVVPAWLYLPFAVTVVVWTSNAVNLTDGLDGLAIGPVMINAGTYLVWAYLAGATFGIAHVAQRFVVARYLDIPPIASAGELAIYCGAMIGAGIGFLWYNTYPAQVFMGDVGSLALGGGLGMCAVFTKNEILSAILGGVFFLEAVSVVVQVTSFRLTGRRIFLMAPIHHHFEKKGWAEPKIIVRFWIISILLALFSLSSLKLR